VQNSFQGLGTGRKRRGRVLELPKGQGSTYVSHHMTQHIILSDFAVYSTLRSLTSSGSCRDSSREVKVFAPAAAPATALVLAAVLPDCGDGYKRSYGTVG
jgi:hypothetical protein